MGTFPGCKADLSPVLWDWFVRYARVPSVSIRFSQFIAAKNSRVTAKISRLAEQYVINLTVYTAFYKKQNSVELLRGRHIQDKNTA